MYGGRMERNVVAGLGLIDDDAVFAIGKETTNRIGLEQAAHDLLLRFGARLERTKTLAPASGPGVISNSTVVRKGPSVKFGGWGRLPAKAAARSVKTAPAPVRRHIGRKVHRKKAKNSEGASCAVRLVIASV